MKRSKNLLRKGAALAAMSTVLVSQAPLINAFAYGEADVSQSTFKQDTDNSADFQNWLSNVWQGGEKAYAQTENVALTPGSDAADLNFSWYSAGKGTPAVKVWKDGSKSSAKVVTGNAESISAENWQGKSYSAANKVNIADYFEENTQYHYQYTDNYTGDEIKENRPDISAREIFRSGINIGRDMIGTMSNTLILAYAGGSLGLVMIIYAYSYQMHQILNMYSVAIEIMRGISGTMGIILTVPITSLIMSVLLTQKGKK